MDVVDFAYELETMLEGYPSMEPEYTLAHMSVLLREEPTEPTGRAMLVALWASRWYIKWRSTSEGDFDDYIDNAAQAGTVLRGLPCNAPERHSHTSLGDEAGPAEAGAIAASIIDAEAWSSAEPDAAVDAAKIEKYGCPAFLAMLAAEVVRDLEAAKQERFLVPATGHLDERYAADPDAFPADLERQRSTTIDPDAQAASVWAARRLRDDVPPDERACLALAVCFMVEAGRFGSPAPGVIRFFHDALTSLDPTAGSCDHAEGHPSLDLKDTPEHLRSRTPGALCSRRVTEEVDKAINAMVEHLDPDGGEGLRDHS
ncbi:hypothetical protein [Actinomadura mexicana]|uniref:Uncharacterized protein n=1 Tax=Actinomadura mexicana TaxID=134959 RepID=A0A239CS12_9ACTN|nr:hypothetical protein [Actinomadura mexicana]SNS22163.1 hypothetical protein SAMN06265355_11348 [Actinomadura mexicana]